MPTPGEPSSGAAIVEQVRRHGIHDARVLNALGRVSRERFIPPDERPHAAEDRALPIGLDQTISQPFIVALMTLELALTGTERVLEIGTGSGYQTAILAQLAGEVFTVERLRLLSLRARGILDGMGITNVHHRVGDGSLGWPQEAPFDRILVTAAAPAVPRTLFEQLVEGGLMIAPLGDDEDQYIMAIRRQDGGTAMRKILPCRFVKLIGEEGWAP
jgi:protein-L-isoaspartate(D-aspartate) O-methyltransferase